MREDMPKYHKILQNPRRLRAMTGLDRDAFDHLHSHFQHALEQLMARQTIDGYVREGRRFTSYRNSPLPTAEDKLLFILTYLKINPIQEMQGQMFDMSQSNVSKWFHLLHDVLNLALAQQHNLPARNAQELAKLLQSAADTTSDDQDDDDADGSAPRRFFHDGTERPINRPTDQDEQKFYYSGKSKQHAVKNVLVVDERRRIDYLSDTYEGKAHDKRVADESGYSLPDGSELYQDTGFQGFRLEGVTIIQPKKKPKNGRLTPEEKEENRRISSIRVQVEHAIGSVKRFSIVRETIRFWCAIVRDKVMETCCGLHNFLLSVKNPRIVCHEP
jgi:DDE superfamily endonuclease/Helix-turn-helix of DDE superfamily endonuclease